MAHSSSTILTKAKLWAAFFVQLNEAYQMTFLLPMVVFMCRDFGIAPNMLGIYTSLLNASFMFCQFLTSYAWGSFSDKFGRRIALASGLIFSTIGVFIFGLSKSYTHAIIARCICGFFNGNLGVIKAYLADITDSTNRGFAFSILAVSFGFGSVLGSMMGGLLIKTHNVDLPDEQYEPTIGILNFWIFKTQFPFLLPCLFGAAVSFNGLLFTLYTVHDEKQSELIMIETNILTKKQNYMSIETNVDDCDEMILKPTVSCETNNSYPIPILHNEYSSNVKKRKVALLSFLEKDEFNDECDADEMNSLAKLLQKTDLFKTLFCYVTVAIAYMMFTEMNPVYMAQALFFDSQFIGYNQAWSGVNLLVFTLYFQPYFLNNFGHRNMGIFSAFCLAISILLMPSIYLITDVKWIALVLSFFCSTLMNCFASILFVISMCFINNSVPPNHVGKANGIAQSLASLSRAVGPMVTGFIWSATVNQIEINILAVYYAYLPSFVCFIGMSVHLYVNIKPEMQFTWEKQLQMTNQ